MILEIAHANFGVRRDPQHAGRVELKFGAGRGTGENRITSHQRSVQRGGGHLTRVASPDRHFAIENADSGNAPPGSNLGIVCRTLSLFLRQRLGRIILRPCGGRAHK